MKKKNPYQSPLFSVLQINIKENIMDIISGNIDGSPIDGEGDTIDAF